MFEDFLNHRCDIYHLAENETSPGYGIKAEPSHERLAKPDLEDVPCHFHIKNAGVGMALQITQKEPFSVLEGNAQLSLPYGTDIRENDYVKSRGYIFRAGVPKAVHGNHHIVVTLTREDGIKGAI